MHRRRVDREVEAGDGRERRREAVHVVEQVERVRDPDEPEERDHDAQHVVRDELDAEPGGDRDPGRRELGDELRDRAQVPDVVDEPRDEQQPAPGEDSGQLPRRLHRVDGQASTTPAAIPQAMPTPPNVGVAARATARRWVVRPAARRRREREEGPRG